jgi:hypothetical protein
MLDFNTIKNFYNKGLWSAQLVLMAVRKGILTENEANDIINSKEE